MEIIISSFAIFISVFTLINQRYGISKQMENHKQQSELQALSSLLDAEIHLHNFNNQKSINPEQQKKWAANNFDEIIKQKKEISIRIK